VKNVTVVLIAALICLASCRQNQNEAVSNADSLAAMVRDFDALSGCLRERASMPDSTCNRVLGGRTIRILTDDSIRRPEFANRAAADSAFATRSQRISARMGPGRQCSDSSRAWDTKVGIVHLQLVRIDASTHNRDSGWVVDVTKRSTFQEALCH
jgi:hypothetical protein